MKAFVAHFGLRAHIIYNHKVVRAEWHAEQKEWSATLQEVQPLDTAPGAFSDKAGAIKRLRAPILVGAVGGLHVPVTPNVAGKELFSGEQFHTAAWNMKFDPTGKRIAIIGNAASAIQVIPAIADKAKQVCLSPSSGAWLIFAQVMQSDYDDL